ncbi:MAG: DMT family transporter [Bacteroidota bacterium]
MNNAILLVLSFIVGIMVVIQGGLNAKLGVLLKNPLLATSAMFIVSTCFTAIAILLTVKQLPSVHQLKAVPLYLWFTGAAFSFAAVSLFYFLIPKLGISTAVAFGLFGQIFFSTVAAHYGWFGLPVEPIAKQKILGVMAMILGLFLIKF